PLQAVHYHEVGGIGRRPVGEATPAGPFDGNGHERRRRHYPDPGPATGVPLPEYSGRRTPEREGGAGGGNRRSFTGIQRRWNAGWRRVTAGAGRGGRRSRSRAGGGRGRRRRRRRGGPGRRASPWPRRRRHRPGRRPGGRRRPASPAPGGAT